MASSESSSHILHISINGPKPHEMQTAIDETIEEIKLLGIICDVSDNINNGITTITVSADCTFNTAYSIRMQLMRCIDCAFKLNKNVRCHYSSQLK